MATRSRFTHEQKMDKIKNSINIDGDCHPWTGTLSDKKYPRCYNIFVRNYLWNLCHSKLTRSDTLDSTCKNHLCVNVNHLYIRSREIDWDQVWERLKNNTDEDGECMIWNKLLHPNGYGITTLKKKSYCAHRLAYMVKLKGKPVPTEINGEKAMIRHLCNKPRCINPDHLQLGTYVENCADKVLNNTTNRGESSHLAKITELVARDIKLSRLEKGEEGYKTQTERADFFGVSQFIVQNIDHGSSWAHLPDRYGNTHTENNKEANKKKTMRRKRNNDQEFTPAQFAKAGEILYSQVTKTSKNEGVVNGECWERGGCRMNGYARFTFQGRVGGAHVWSCEIAAKRRRRDGEVTRHLCGNKVCVNPDHLRFGTNSENMIDTLVHGTRSAKLDPDKVREIRASGLTRKELVKKYGVSKASIRTVLIGESWKFVE